MILIFILVLDNFLVVQGNWLLLLDGQTCLPLLESLESLLNKVENVDSSFRLWISCNAKSNFPSSLLQSSVMVVIESPKMVSFANLSLKIE